jgi:hypothetical protein
VPIWCIVIGTLFHSSSGSKIINLAGKITDQRCIPNHFSGGFGIQFTQSRHLHQNGMDIL